MALAEHQLLIRDMAREFAQAELAPGAAERDRTGEVPLALLARMGELGLMGMCVPEALGGAGADYVSYVLALMEIAAADGGVSTVMSVNNAPVCAAVETYGTPEQHARYLRELARGEAIGAFLLTEPQAGSDASALRTRARRHGNEWAISGTKQFITSGRTARYAMVFALTDPAAGKRGISCFLTPTDRPGYRVASVEHKAGQRCSDTCQIVLEELVVQDKDMLGGPGDGYRIALANLSTGRIGIAGQATGMARAAYEAALGYARERTAFGKPIVEHQAVAFRLADMATELTAAESMLLHAARLKDTGVPCLRQASMAKLYASEMAERVCSAAIQTHGGYGYLNDFPVERIWRDVRVCQIYEGTSDVQKIVIARDIADGDEPENARQLGVDEEQMRVRDTARAFARAELLPNVAAWERAGAVPRQVLGEMGQLGLMGVTVPAEWGGGGADFVAYILAMEEIAAPDGGISNMMSANNSPLCAALLKHGTETQKRRWLPALAGGEMLGALLLTEPHAGSDTAAIRSTARRRGDGFVLNGTKSFITMGRTADLAMIVAVTDPAKGRKGISCFLTPTDNPGYRVARVEDKVGHRTCDTCQIDLADMAVPADHLLGPEGEGLGIALGFLNLGRIAVAAQAVGAARAALQAAAGYAREREAFGKPIVEHQAVGFRLAEMATAVEVARRLTLHAARLAAEGLPCRKEASMAKLFASEMAERICSQAMQTHGGLGFLRDCPVEKYWRDVRVTQIYEGTNDIQRLVIGREIVV